MPSASVGSGVEAVKSIAMPTTSSGSTPAAATAAGTASRSDLEVVLGVLQRPVGGSRSPVAGSSRSITRVGELVDCRAELRAVAHAHDDRAPGERAEVDPDDETRRPPSLSPSAWSPIAAIRARRYSLTTMSVSSSTDVSAVGLSNAISPSWIMLTRSQACRTWT